MFINYFALFSNHTCTCMVRELYTKVHLYVYAYSIHLHEYIQTIHACKLKSIGIHTDKSIPFYKLIHALCANLTRPVIKYLYCCCKSIEQSSFKKLVPIQNSLNSSSFTYIYRKRSYKFSWSQYFVSLI